jgi:hypothetical protein
MRHFSRPDSGLTPRAIRFRPFRVSEPTSRSAAKPNTVELAANHGRRTPYGPLPPLWGGIVPNWRNSSFARLTLAEGEWL